MHRCSSSVDVKLTNEFKSNISSMGVKDSVIGRVASGDLGPMGLKYNNLD